MKWDPTVRPSTPHVGDLYRDATLPDEECVKWWGPWLVSHVYEGTVWVRIKPQACE